MSLWHSAVEQACNKICELESDNVGQEFYDFSYNILVENSYLPIDGIMKFCTDVSWSVAKTPSLYKVADFEVQPLHDATKIRIWFKLRPSLLTDL